MHHHVHTSCLRTCDDQCGLGTTYTVHAIAYVRKKWTLISALSQHCVALAICICSDPAEQASCRLHAPYREASDTLWVTKSDVPLETCWPAVMMVCEVQVYLVTHHTQHAQKKFGSADCGHCPLSFWHQQYTAFLAACPGTSFHDLNT